MKEASLGCKTRRKFKATTDSKHNKPVAPNLLERKFNVAKPNTYWVGILCSSSSVSAFLAINITLLPMLNEKRVTSVKLQYQCLVN